MSLLIFYKEAAEQLLFYVQAAPLRVVSVTPFMYTSMKKMATYRETVKQNKSASASLLAV